MQAVLFHCFLFRFLERFIEVYNFVNIEIIFIHIFQKFYCKFCEDIVKIFKLFTIVLLSWFYKRKEYCWPFWLILLKFWVFQNSALIIKNGTHWASLVHSIMSISTPLFFIESIDSHNIDLDWRNKQNIKNELIFERKRFEKGLYFDWIL